LTLTGRLLFLLPASRAVPIIETGTLAESRPRPAQS
jgi:hypothetical protein